MQNRDDEPDPATSKLFKLEEIFSLIRVKEFMNSSIKRKVSWSCYFLYAFHIYINISRTQGDVMGVGISSSGNIMGKNIVVGSGTINVSHQELAKIAITEHAKANPIILKNNYLKHYDNKYRR